MSGVSLKPSADQVQVPGVSRPSSSGRASWASKNTECASCSTRLALRGPSKRPPSAASFRCSGLLTSKTSSTTTADVATAWLLADLATKRGPALCCEQQAVDLLKSLPCQLLPWVSQQLCRHKRGLKAALPPQARPDGPANWPPLHATAQFLGCAPGASQSTVRPAAAGCHANAIPNTSRENPQAPCTTLSRALVANTRCLLRGFH